MRCLLELTVCGMESMSRSVAILLLVSSVVLSSPALGARQQGASTNIIRIDAKKNPGSAPEYRVRERVRQ